MFPLPRGRADRIVPKKEPKMYPLIRLAFTMRRAKKAGPMTVDETHETYVRILPSDIDPFMELNNGRTLTLFELGRFASGWQMGMLKTIKAEKWGLTVAGSSVLYRRRVRLFDKVKIKTKTMGRDARFLYVVQTMYRGDQPTSNLLCRVAFTDKNGIVPTQNVADAMGIPDWNPTMPAWIENWIKAESTRDWPPMV